MARITVFGAGAMGTAFAMHLARQRNEVALWASPFDERIFPSLADERRHPALPEHLPDRLAVMAADELAEAGKGIDIAVLGAHSAGARNLAKLVLETVPDLPLVVGVAKGLEPGTDKRMSEVYSEEVGHDRVVSVGGPALAHEVAEGLPTAAVFAAGKVDAAEDAAGPFRSPTMQVAVTDDLLGLEYCTVAKNVAAIAMGILDGLGKGVDRAYSNAKAALFTQAFHEMAELVAALGGRRETVRGLAGIGDTLVTSLGGRNRLFGEMIGQGASPENALERLNARGMTVEGWDSAREIGRLADRAGVELPFFEEVHRILFDGARADELFGCLKQITG